jgi:hypothetical protein
MDVSIISVQGSIDAFKCISANLRIAMEAFQVAGNSSTGNGIYFGPTTLLNGSLFKNVLSIMGGRAFFLPKEFNTQLINCQGGSYNNNVFELQGGNTTKLQGCYALQVPSGKYGYRLYGGAFLDSCNGINAPFVGGIGTGGDWGLFGQDMAKGDATYSQYNVVMINCNVEDFNQDGVRFRYDGVAKITNCSFLAKSQGSYRCEIYVEYCNLLVSVETTRITPKGGTRSKLSPIFADQGSNIFTALCESVVQIDVNGTLFTLPSLAVSYPAYLQFATHFNSLAAAQFYNHYCGTVALSGGVATVALSPGQFDAQYQVFLTGNQPEIFRCIGKSTSSFQIASNNSSSTASVDWFISRTG